MLKKKKESKVSYPSIEPVVINGRCVAPPYMREKIDIFLNNNLFVEWVSEFVDELCRQIRELRTAEAEYYTKRIEKNFLCFITTKEIDCRDLNWNFCYIFEDYKMENVSGEMWEAMSLAAYQYICDRLKNESFHELHDKNFKYNIQHYYKERGYFDVQNSYIVSIRIEVDNPVFEEKKSW